ncbi:hypothetical protein [Dictyobacter alpinus]|uniref:hypothetical protein n=1 Tax=Dictyobacter alpinus TaxID=2014873 RepID=UPI000F847CEB|nr:hypothetical protein [Dictyobacter alpinus]
MDSHAHALEHWANRLDRQRYSYDRRGAFAEAKHWKARGSQKTLRWVAGQLKSLRDQHDTEYGLYKALKEYVECLMTSSTDAQEEIQNLRTRQRRSAECWKAEGEAYVLPRIHTKLARLVDNYTPEAGQDVYSLSLDGTYLVSFPENEDEPVPVETTCLPAVFEHGESSFVAPRAARSGRPLEQKMGNDWFATLRPAAREIIRVQESASAPRIGPFPVLPDNLAGYHRDAIVGIEATLAGHGRVLVKLSPGQDNTGALFACLDRLLLYSYVSRILVVTAQASLKPELVRAYNAWISYEDEASLSERYPVQTSVKETITSCVSIASIREMQMAMRRTEPLPRATFDVLVLYGYPFISQMWRTVLEYFTAPSRIGFSEALDDELAAQFDHHIVFAIPDQVGADRECQEVR